MPGRVEGKGIVITGAASGMGRAFALACASEGASVGVLDRDEVGAERVCEEIRDRVGGPAIALVADVSQRGQVASAPDRFIENVGNLDVLFNDAGLNRPMHLIDVTEENWYAIMNVNALGCLIGI